MQPLPVELDVVPGPDQPDAAGHRENKRRVHTAIASQADAGDAHFEDRVDVPGRQRTVIDVGLGRLRANIASGRQRDTGVPAGHGRDVVTQALLNAEL